LKKNVKAAASARAVVESGWGLEVNVVRKSESRPNLPREQERVRCWNVLGETVAVRGSGRSNRILRILIVVNELCEICEDVDLQLERFSRSGYDVFALFAVSLLAIGWCRSAPAAKADIKRMLPLLGEALRIDVVIP